MFYFIHYLRAIATVLITNSHYSNIWPNANLAAGGLLGNILFFAASGFCLFRVKEGFGKWYVKRIAKIYPVMVGFTLVTVLLGRYPLRNLQDAVKLFLFPTNYIFLVWLMLCYVVFYVVAWLSQKYENATEYSLVLVLIAWLVTYFAFVDKSAYHIDNVDEPFILFLYFSSMLIGALFRKHMDKIRKVRWYGVVGLLAGLLVYFGSKIAFSKIQAIVFWQILNQLSVLVVLGFVFAVFIGLEPVFKRFPMWLNKTVKFVATITLHIYLVQFVVIYTFEGLMFPLNFVVTTALILAAASALYFAEAFTRKGILCLTKKIVRKKENAKSND